MAKTQTLKLNKIKESFNLSFSFDCTRYGTYQILRRHSTVLCVMSPLQTLPQRKFLLNLRLIPISISRCRCHQLTESHSPRCSTSNSVMELHTPTTLPFFSLLRILLNDNIRLTGERNDDSDSHPSSHPKFSICNEVAAAEEEAPTGPDRFTSSRTGSVSHTITATSDRVSRSGIASTVSLQSGHVA